MFVRSSASWAQTDQERAVFARARRVFLLLFERVPMAVAPMLHEQMYER